MRLNTSLTYGLKLQQRCAQKCLRSLPTLEADSKNPSSCSRLAAVCCAIDGCQWRCGAPGMTLSSADRKEAHPWDAMLRLPVEEAHADAVCNIAKTIFEEMPSERRVWDVYKEAIAIREREKFPQVGLSEFRVYLSSVQRCKC